jgi:hypothetical protein
MPKVNYNLNIMLSILFIVYFNQYKKNEIKRPWKDNPTPRFKRLASVLGLIKKYLACADLQN